MLYLLLALVLGMGGTIYLIKKGQIEDKDGDFIPDALEEKLEDAAELAKEIKLKAETIKEEVEDIVEEVQDVVSAIKGKPTKSKLNSLTKQDLVNSAKADHDVDLDLNTKKTTLVNKVYSLYNKK